jgi:precorrin-6A/cobalt-precorrin-6A reductase
MTFKVLILGGTSDARRLAERLRDAPGYATLLSFAGRTSSLQRPNLPHRVGGFGGVSGLAEFLAAEQFDALVDATHAYAAQMSRHALEAAERTRTPLLRFERPAWRAEAGDRWIEVADMTAAARALPTESSRVFLSVGRQEIAAFRAALQHRYVVRAIDQFDPGLPQARVIAARGPFDLDAELALLRSEQIAWLVSKNSGSPETHPKLMAARALQLPVIMLARPAALPSARCETLDEALAWLSAQRDHGDFASRRGE